MKESFIQKVNIDVFLCKKKVFWRVLTNFIKPCRFQLYILYKHRSVDMNLAPWLIIFETGVSHDKKLAIKELGFDPIGIPSIFLSQIWKKQLFSKHLSAFFSKESKFKEFLWCLGNKNILSRHLLALSSEKSMLFLYTQNIYLQLLDQWNYGICIFKYILSAYSFLYRVLFRTFSRLNGLRINAKFPLSLLMDVITNWLWIYFNEWLIW